MVSSSFDRHEKKTKQNRFPLRIGSRVYHLDFENMILVGYKLLKFGKYQAAAAIFGAMVSHNQRPDHAIELLLARCQIHLKEYECCKQTLQSTFSGKEENFVEPLHSALIFQDCGMLPDAVRELHGVMKSHPPLPAICLLVGDLFAAIGAADTALLCWRLAIDRDNPAGVTAIIARWNLRRILGSVQFAAVRTRVQQEKMPPMN